MAWLNATPRPVAEPAGQNAPKRQSRLEEMKAQEREIDAPPNPAPEITGWLFRAGPVDTSGMSPSPLSWSEITEWQRNSGVRLLPWQAELLRRLSREFVDEMMLAQDPQRPAPWVSDRPPTKGEMEVQDQMLRFMIGFQGGG